MEMHIGNILRETREKKGLSLADVENETKIRTKYLAALESESFDEIPGEAYVIGFLRNYARFLGLDADLLVNEYKRSKTKDCIAEESSSIAQAEPLQPSGRKIITRREIIIGISLILLLIITMVVGLLWPKKEKASRTQHSITHDSVVTQNIAEKTETNSTQNLTIELVAAEKCWFKVVTDGQEEFSGMLYPGMRKKFQAKDAIAIRLGNAGGVEVIYNGKKLPPLGKRGEVVDRIFHKTE